MAHSHSLQPKCACGGTPGPTGEGEECRKKRQGTLQRAASDRSPVGEVPGIVHDVLRSPGQPLDVNTRAFMEPRFGHDFSQVRVHSDEQAARSARAVNALAYTVGQDIVFGPGQYAPHARDGRHLIAHELMHTIQQAQSVGRLAGYSRLEVGEATSPEETESEAMAEAVVNMPSPGMPVQAQRAIPASGRPALQRKVSPKLAEIKKLLSKRVSEKDTHQVLGMFKAMSHTDLRDTVRALDLENHDYIERFLINISESDRGSEFEELVRIKNARVWRIETTTKDPGTKSKTTVTTEVTGSCSPDQFQKLYNAGMTSLGWLNTAVRRLDAFIKDPGDKKNADVERALNLHFHSKADDVVKHIRERLARIRNDIGGLKTLEIECHGVWDNSCASAAAYVPGGNPNLIVFCHSFFGYGATWQAEAVIHEMAHAQVGGAHITDRAYQSDRLLTHLSTADALTNAESYGLLVQQLGTGKVVSSTAPKDTREDCPDDWWRLITKALALAQRWNRNLENTIENLTPNDIKPPSKTGTYLGGTSQADINRARKAVDRVKSKLRSSIDFECEPGGGGRCKKFDTYWWATGDFHICPSWVNQKNEDDRVESMLAGLYGYIGDVDNQTQRSNYAKYARENQASWAPTSLGKVLGSKAWTPDELSVDVAQQEPRLSKYLYTESGTRHERISSDLPIYQASAGLPAPLPYRCDVTFSVDSSSELRPAPFTPPLVSAELEFKAGADSFKSTFRDARPTYYRNGSVLETKLPRPFKFDFSKNGDFHMRFQLEDPDTKITRVFDDTIQIKAV
jgi:hypothetical protein